MPLYQYKCLNCGRIEEKFRRVDDRENEFPCNGRVTTINNKGFIIKRDGICAGTMIFQPIESMKGGTFRMHDPTERQGQYGGE